MYSLGKLKLDLTKLVSGPDCRHVSKPVKALGKRAEAKYVQTVHSCQVGQILFPYDRIRETLLAQAVLLL